MVSALILVVAMVFQIVPNQIFADIGSGAIPSEGYGCEESITSPAVFVEGEMPDLRSEDGKHFKLSDGSFISVSYGSSVHYLDSEGKWQDIDNSLTLDKDGECYSTKVNGDRSFTLAKDLSSGELAAIHYGDSSVSLSLAGEYNRNAVLEIKAKDTEKPKEDESGWTMENLTPEDLDTKVIYKES